MSSMWNIASLFWASMKTKIDDSRCLAARLVMIFLLVSHMVSIRSERDTGSLRVFRPDHEYLGKGFIPSKHIENPVIERYGLSGMLHEIRLEMQGSSFQCFYQLLQRNAKFFIFFQVLRGSDKNIDLEIIRPDGVALKSFQWLDQGTFEDVVQIEGTYAICLDNRLSRFSSKVVYVYMNSYFDYEWEKFAEDYQGSVSSISNFSSSFQNIDHKIKEMISLVSADSQLVIKDWYLIRDSNRYVQNLSIFMCILIVATSALQVVFVRRLFAPPKTSKPRV